MNSDNDGTERPGAAGDGPGGGGSGAADDDDTGSLGGAGGKGMVVIYEYTTYIGGADLAENYPTSDVSLSAGDIVAFDADEPGYIERAVAGARRPLAGIISTQPGQLLGIKERATDSLGERPVALSGRVPTKVNLEGGAIAVGDRIALSSVPGVGRKATSFEASVGVALEPYPATGVAEGPQGKIEVFINLQPGLDIEGVTDLLIGPLEVSFSPPIPLREAKLHAATSSTTELAVEFALELDSASTTSTDSTTLTASSSPQTASSTPPYQFATSFLARLAQTLMSWFASAGNGIGEVFARVFRAKEMICIGETCVNETQLKALLAGTATSTVASVATSTPPVEEPNEPELEPESDKGEGTGDDMSTSTPDAADIEEESASSTPEMADVEEVAASSTPSGGEADTTIEEPEPASEEEEVVETESAEEEEAAPEPTPEPAAEPAPAN